jgi:hypothetical protein
LGTGRPIRPLTTYKIFQQSRCSVNYLTASYIKIRTQALRLFGGSPYLIAVPATLKALVAIGIIVFH